MSGEEFAKLSISEQLAYLHSITDKDYGTDLQAKADAARELRDLTRNGNSFDIYELMWGYQGDKRFMNEICRDFLNTSDNGLPYVYSDIMKSSDWEQRVAKEHQAEADKKNPNKKFVNVFDGREAVFTYINGEWILSTNERDKGTYNYAKNSGGLLSWTVSSEHGILDMDPYFEQFGYTPLYRSVFGYFYSKFDYQFQGY